MANTRRSFLTTAAGVASAGAIAGCLDGIAGGAGDDSTAQATFFVFGDIADEVAGDAASTNLLVPVGQHGHGWEPGPRVREDIYNAALLLHGMDGFQPWVDDIRGDLEDDDADVRDIDVTAGLDLLEAGHVHDHGQDEHDEEHSEESHDGEDDHHDDGSHDEEGHDEDSHDDGSHDQEVHDDGSHDEEHSEDSHDEAAGEDDAEHSEGLDPHFWMDPTRVAAAVDTVRQGLADVDGDNADAYADNAEAYRSRLAELDQQFESTVEDGEKSVLLVAGHDAFQYMGERYGIEVHALTDVSPDDRVTATDITAAQDVIDEHGLSYICADPLESQEAAEQLVAETDAEDVLPLTSIPGLKAEWDDNDWGYVDVMEKVNLPTLERALDV